MNNELWSHATEKSKIQWLRQRIVALTKERDEFKKRIDNQDERMDYIETILDRHSLRD